jgi:hypothetical protein
MKKLYSLGLFLISFTLLSQTPYVVNYQGVARYANGDPIVGPLGINVVIHVGSASGPATLTEQHSTNTNQFGIFEIRIGSNTAGGLSNIGWGTNKYFLGVAIDPNGGTNYGTEISNQQFVSVPYALYAEKSGGGSTGTLTASPNVTVTSAGTNSFNINVPNYVAGSNVTITPQSGNNYQINVGNTSTSVPSGLWTQTAGATFLANSLDNVGIGTSGPAAKLEVSANPFSTNNAIAAYAQGGNGVLALTSSTNNLNAAVMASNSGSGHGVIGTTGATNGSIAGLVGQNTGAGPGVIGSNTSGNNLATSHGIYGETNSSSPTAAGVIGSNSGAGPGVYGYQGTSNGGAGVWGIGNSTVAAAIHGIHNNGFASVFGDNGTASASSNAIGVWGRTNSTSSLTSGVYGQNTGAGNGVKGDAVSNNTAVAGVFGTNTGSGSGVLGLNNGTGYGVRGITNSASNTIAAVVGFNNNGGSGVRGETIATNTLAAAVIGVNNGAGNGVFGITTSANGSINGVKGINNSAGAGVSGDNLSSSALNSAHGVRGETNAGGTLAAGVFGMNSGSGPGVYGSANGAGPAVYGWRNTGTGPAGRFETSNNSEALLAMTTGTAAAVHAQSGAAGTSTLALLIDNGHVKSIGTQPNVSTYTNTGGVSIISYTTVGCTDVKGTLLAVATTTGMINVGGLAGIRVNFNKAYSAPPTVVITPTSDFLGMSYYISGVTQTYFQVLLKNNTATNIPGTSLVFNFNYMVIE